MTDSDLKSEFKETHPVAKRRVLHAIAVFEAVKGIAAFAALIGVLDMMHHDVRHLAIELIGRFGLNPSAHYPSILLHYAELVPNADMHSLVIFACAYILVRLLEGYGLWNDLAWGEWLGGYQAGSIYPLKSAILFINRQP